MIFEDIYDERLELVIERIGQIEEGAGISASYADYFQQAARLILKLNAACKNDKFNRDFFAEFDKENYENSYANPSYACEKLGTEYGQL